MHRKDFILRIIEEIVRMIARMTGLMKEGQFSKAGEMAGQTLKDFFSLEADTIDTTGEEELLELLVREKQLDNRQLAVIAEILHLHGDALKGEGKTEHARIRYRKALSVYRYLESSETRTFSLERKNRILLLQALLGSSE
jgi:hypothetical protein